MLHGEREISLLEIANALKSIYQTIDKLDSKLISLEPGKRESIFIKNPDLYNRKAVSFAYDLLNAYIKYEIGRDVKLCLYNKPLQDIIDTHESFETVVDNFCNGGEELDYSNQFYIKTYFFGELSAHLIHLVETALSMCLKYEIDILTNFSSDRREKELKKRIKELERNKYFFSKEHSIQLNSYANQKLEKLKYVQEDLEEEQEGIATNSLRACLEV
ncbi:MAG: hypothetical protein KDE33_22250 [Bacteroidetes bacterium]|nr:hypothetical protein [Bacteroidota bacterium]